MFSDRNDPASRDARCSHVEKDTVRVSSDVREKITAALELGVKDPAVLPPLAREALTELAQILAAPERKTHLSPRCDLDTAQAIIDSLRFQRGIATMTIPEGVSDEAALKALNRYLRRFHPELGRDSIGVPDITPLTALEESKSRDISRPREIDLEPLAPGTTERSRDAQIGELQRQGKHLPHPIEAALVAAAYDCREGGRDIFRGHVVRCRTGALLFRNHGLCFQSTYGFDSAGSALIAAAAAAPKE